MATQSLKIKTFSDGSFQIENPEPEPTPSIYRHKDDKEIWGANWIRERSCAPCPAVWELGSNSVHKVVLTEQWQYFIRAINWGMTLSNVSGLFGAKKAFTNRSDDPRANWLLRKDLNAKPPDQDKVRSCSRSPITVTAESGDFVIIKMMDGTKPPPLKEGFSYPDRVSNINPDAYFYHPRTHPSMFLVAANTSLAGRTRPFPNGAIYDWKGDNQPYVFWPYVSNRPIVYLKSYLTPTTNPPPTPYT